MVSALSDEKLGWLSDVAWEWQHSTPGVWGSYVTDDELFLPACYVAEESSGSCRGLLIDGSANQAATARVVAITLLQTPRLAEADAAGANAVFIARVHQHVPRMLTLVQQLAGVRIPGWPE